MALGLSLYTIWRQHGLDKLNKRLNALLIEKEEAESVSALRADLSAEFRSKSRNNYELRVFNRGRGAARQVRMEVLSGGDLFSPGDLARKFPYPSLDVHQSFGLLAAVHMQSPTRATVRLKWEDDAGGGEKEVTADVF